MHYGFVQHQKDELQDQEAACGPPVVVRAKKTMGWFLCFYENLTNQVTGTLCSLTAANSSKCDCIWKLLSQEICVLALKRQTFSQPRRWSRRSTCVEALSGCYWTVSSFFYLSEEIPVVFISFYFILFFALCLSAGRGARFAFFCGGAGILRVVSCELCGSCILHFWSWGLSTFFLTFFCCLWMSRFFPCLRIVSWPD